MGVKAEEMSIRIDEVVGILNVFDEPRIRYEMRETKEYKVIEQRKDTQWGREIYVVDIGKYKSGGQEYRDLAVMDKTVYEGIKRGEIRVEVVDEYEYSLDMRVRLIDKDGYRVHHMTGRPYTGLEMGLINRSYEAGGGYINKEFIEIVERLGKGCRPYNEGRAIKVKEIKDGQEKTFKEGWRGKKIENLGGYEHRFEVEIKDGIKEEILVSGEIELRV